MIERVPATLLVLVAIVSAQVGAGIARSQFELIGPFGATFLRLSFAAVILLVILRPKLRHWTARAWLAATLLGLALAGMNTMIYLSFDSIPLGVAVTIEFLGPLVLALAQARRIVDVMWAALAFAGVLLLGFDVGGSIAIAGLVFAALAGTFWAGYILASANVGRAIPGTDGLAVALAIGAILSAPLGAGPAYVAAVEHPPILLIFVAVAVLSSVLSYGLELEALRRLPTRVFGVLSALGPAVAAIVGFLVLSQALGWRQITALLLVTIASVGVTVARGRAKPSVATEL